MSPQIPIHGPSHDVSFYLSNLSDGCEQNQIQPPKALLFVSVEEAFVLWSSLIGVFSGPTCFHANPQNFLFLCFS